MIDFDKVDLEFPAGWFSSYDMAAMYPALAESTKDDVYLEIGVDRGKSLSFARKYFKGDVFGIDISTIKQRGGDKVPDGASFILSDSIEAVWNTPIKVLFIDGEHRYQRVKDEWAKYSPYVVKGGWVFWHDADETSPEVVRFLKELKEVKYDKNPRCSMAWKKL